MKYIYVLNRFQTREKTPQLIKKLEETSARFNREYEIRIHETPEDAARLKEDYRDTEYIVTAIGGDGSINHLLNDLVGTKNILSFIPFGTGNDFARAMVQELSDPVREPDIQERGNQESGLREADIVRINDRYFINVACFGIDADIANDDRFVHSRLIPKPLRFHAGVLFHFLSYRKGRRLKVECNGETIEKEVTSVVAANSQYYGGGYRISPGSRIDDGIMEIYIVDHLSRPRMAKVILSMKHAGHLNHPAVRMIQSGKAVVSSPVPFRANIDGEPLYSDRFEIELIPKGIRLAYDKAFLESFMSQG